MLLAMQISKLVGQIISLRLSIGNVAMRQTRYIEITVASSTSSDKNKFSQRKAKDEVLFCKRFFHEDLKTGSNVFAQFPDKFRVTRRRII